MDQFELQPRLMPVKDSLDSSQEKNALVAQDLASALVATKLSLQDNPVLTQDAHGDLVKLMESPAIQAILESANILARQSGIPPTEALNQMILHLKKMDILWDQALIREGLARLSSQFH